MHTKMCDKCRKRVPFILYITKMGCKSERWCLSCVKKKFGCVCGKCEICKRKKAWQEFERTTQH